MGPKPPKHLVAFETVTFWLPCDILTLFRIGLFGAAHGRGEAKRLPLPKICYTYPTMMKLSTVESYLKNIQKIYKSRDTPLSSADISIFQRESANFAISINTDTDCILTRNL